MNRETAVQKVVDLISYGTHALVISSDFYLELDAYLKALSDYTGYSPDKLSPGHLAFVVAAMEKNIRGNDFLTMGSISNGVLFPDVGWSQAFQSVVSEHTLSNLPTYKRISVLATLDLINEALKVTGKVLYNEL